MEILEALIALKMVYKHYNYHFQNFQYFTQTLDFHKI